MSRPDPHTSHPSSRTVVFVLLAATAVLLGCVEERINDGDGGFFSEPDFGSAPSSLDVGPTVVASDAPPPIIGGTLAMAPDGRTAVAADPARDKVYLIDTVDRTLRATIELEEDDEPGRVVVDGDMRAHVVLRRGGAVARIDLETAEVLGRTPVCASPRGIDFDPVLDAVHVACLGGRLETLASVDHQSVRSTVLEPGLRDVVVNDLHVYVSRFREAEVLAIDQRGELAARLSPPEMRTSAFVDGEERTVTFTPGVAWRMLPNPDGGVLLVHQRGRDGEVSIERGGYGSGGGCGTEIVHAAVSELKPGATPKVASTIFGSVLPVDGALSPDGNRVTVVSAGSAMAQFAMPALSEVDLRGNVGDPCGFGSQFGANTGDIPIAAVRDGQGTLLVQSREPAQLTFIDAETFGAQKTIELDTESVADTGLRIFHMDSGGGIACASCHPEGGDDARAWEFADLGARRTQSLQGGILRTAPFHWDGTLTDVTHIMDEVFVERMGGGQPSPDQALAVANWMDTLVAPKLAVPVDMAAVERGRLLFFDEKVACGSCHIGGNFTNNETVDVGTGGDFQVPALFSIASRGPFIHDGCADTLHARFTAECGGGDKHGVTSHLTDTQIDDLVAYLETL